MTDARGRASVAGNGALGCRPTRTTRTADIAEQIRSATPVATAAATGIAE